MTNPFNIPAPKPDETANERHARWMAEFDHFHAAAGSQPVIDIAPMQDDAGPNCPECGRTVIIRADASQGSGWASGTRNGAAEAWQHTFQCSEYAPHPDSIAGQPGYSAS
jgi:predicted RNA-binding Zn-ribbon protein involved in translation (DUF1610 family)